MTRSNQLAFGLTIFSFLFLYQGISYPMLRINLAGDVESQAVNFSFTILNKSSSILETVQELYQKSNYLVSFLILLFSVVVPVTKGALLLAVSTMKKTAATFQMERFIKALGKWSMADVFVVAVFICYLSTRAMPSDTVHEARLMGFVLKFRVKLAVDSELLAGFYYFLSYCLISLAGISFYQGQDSSKRV